jgi:EpsI family protein
MITKRLLAVQIVLLVGFGAIFLLPHVSKSSPAGIAVALPNVVGAWFGDDSDITPREREILAKDTQFARKIYTGPRGDKIVVSIILSGDDMTNSIHRPERCLPAQGWSLESSSKRVIALRSGKSFELTKLRAGRMIEQDDKSRSVLHNLSYYWFVGLDQMTASHLTRTAMDLRDRIVHGYNQRWAYVTITGIITQGWVQGGRSEEQTAAMLEDFIKDLVPQLKRPEGSALL